MGLSRPSWGHLHVVADHASFILSRHVRGFAWATLLLTAIYTILLIAAITPAGGEMVVFLGLLLMLAFIIMIVNMAGEIAGELESGEALLYLSTPLTRLQYVASWALALFLPAAASYTVTVGLPLAIIDPGMFSGSLVGLVLSVVGELLYYVLILVAAALVIRRTRPVNMVGVFITVLGPLLVGALIAIYTSLTGRTISQETFLSLMGVFHPAVLMLRDFPTGLDTEASLAYSFAASLVLAVLLVMYARERMEV